MHTAARLGAYVAALVLISAGAWATGSAIGPLSPATLAPGSHSSGTPVPGTAGTHGHPDGNSHAAGSATGEPAGLASSRAGYSFVPAGTTLTPGEPATFAYRITGSDGAAVTAFDVEHDKRMHLVVVRRDGTGFQHVHPEMDAGGTWRVPLALPAAGTYRAFADFTPTGGPAMTLGTDLFAPGPFEPVSHSPSRTAVVDGYTVELTGDLVPGAASPLTLTVRRDGVPVTDLEPYLAAYGHLVALREGDLAYLHVHPDGAPGDGRTPAGPEIDFVAEVPTAGGYRMFLDFAHGGEVRTAEFTVPARLDGPAPPAPARHHDGPAGGEEGTR
jgi:hypothetical protein